MTEGPEPSLEKSALCAQVMSEVGVHSRGPLISGGRGSKTLFPESHTCTDAALGGAAARTVDAGTVPAPETPASKLQPCCFLMILGQLSPFAPQFLSLAARTVIAELGAPWAVWGALSA